MSNIYAVLLNLCIFVILLWENQWKHSEGDRSDEIAFLMYIVILGSFLYMLYQIYNIYKEHSAHKVEEVDPVENSEENTDFIFESDDRKTEELNIPDFLRR